MGSAILTCTGTGRPSGWEAAGAARGRAPGTPLRGCSGLHLLCSRHKSKRAPGKSPAYPLGLLGSVAAVLQAEIQPACITLLRSGPEIRIWPAVPWLAVPPSSRARSNSWVQKCPSPPPFCTSATPCARAWIRPPRADVGVCTGSADSHVRFWIALFRSVFRFCAQGWDLPGDPANP